MAEQQSSSNEVESQKTLTLKIELAKLALEAKKVKWTALSVIIPLLAAIGTVAYGIWNTHEQEKANFQLEAAKSVMLAPSPGEAIGRSKLFIKLFGDRLPKNFFPEVNISDIARKRDETLEPKSAFVNAVANRGLTPLETAKLWHALLKEEWSDDKEAMSIIEKAAANTLPPFGSQP